MAGNGKGTSGKRLASLVSKLERKLSKVLIRAGQRLRRRS